MESVKALPVFEFGVENDSSEIKGFIQKVVYETIEFLIQERFLPSKGEDNHTTRSYLKPDVSLESKLAKGEYSRRRLRDEIFGSKHLFGEPAWDMLLDLFVMEQSGRRVSITSACIGSCVAPTTALRWIQALEKEGLVFKVEDETDRRRSFVRLTAAANVKMREYLSALTAN